jgi:hypothetical protein
MNEIKFVHRDEFGVDVVERFDDIKYVMNMLETHLRKNRTIVVICEDNSSTIFNPDEE